MTNRPLDVPAVSAAEVSYPEWGLGLAMQLLARVIEQRDKLARAVAKIASALLWQNLERLGLA